MKLPYKGAVFKSVTRISFFRKDHGPCVRSSHNHPWEVIQVYYPAGQRHTAAWWSHSGTGGELLSLRPPIWSYYHRASCCNGLSVDSGRLLSGSGWWVTACDTISRLHRPERLGLKLNASYFPKSGTDGVRREQNINQWNDEINNQPRWTHYVPLE